MPSSPDRNLPPALRARTAADVRNMTHVRESVLQHHLREQCILRGYGYYHTQDSRMDDAGFLDTVIAGPGGLLWVECKKHGGRLSPHQKTWIAMLAFLGHEVRVYYPKDMNPSPEYSGKSRIQHDLDAIGPRGTGRRWPAEIAAGIRAIFAQSAAKRAKKTTDWRKPAATQSIDTTPGETS